jgi:hypothetical protein
MRIGKWAAAAAIVLSGVAVNAVAVSATTEATARGCHDAARQLDAALQSNQQSPNYADAVKEKNNAASFCVHEMYSAGMVHYNNALKLLGAGKN